MLTAEQYCALGADKGLVLQRWALDERWMRTTSRVADLKETEDWRACVESAAAGSVQYRQFLTVAIAVTRFCNQQKAYTANPARKYRVFRTREELEQFVEQVPPARRQLEEMIFTDTPHRFYMDLERDMPNVTQAELDALEAFLLLRFRAILADFFRETFDHPCAAEDFRVCVASLEGKKFSAHLTLCNGLFCPTRISSWTVAGLLARHLSGIADDPAFSNFYYERPAERAGTMVDYAVYHAGLRNMRFLGSVKIAGPLGTPYQKLRPFTPVPSQRGLPWTDFLCTANDAWQNPLLKPIEPRQEALAALCDWIGLQENTAMRSKFASLASRLGAAAPRVPRAAPGGGALAPRFRHPVRSARAAAQARVLRMIVLAKDRGECPRFARYQDVARKLAAKMLELLHPFNTGTEQPACVDVGEVYKLRFTTLVKDPNGVTQTRVNDRGVLKEQRLCFFSFEDGSTPCEQGSHQAELVVRSDFAVHYFCFHCKRRAEIVASPIDPRSRLRVRPNIYNEPPSEFTCPLDIVPYERDDFEINNTSVFMREIKPLHNGRHWDHEVRRSVLLHAPMGSGKSFACKHYLDAAERCVRRQLGREPRVLSVCFRTMLARSNSKTFNLVAYNDDAAHGSLFQFDRVACQLDSICRLGQVEGDLYVIKNPWDIVLLDESESILSHLSSQTLDKRRAEVFEIFKLLVSCANTCIVADADLGHRTRYFISQVRPHCQLEYHRNPWVRTWLEYIDYKYFKSWLDALADALFGKNPKCVFVVSNHKRRLKTLERFLLAELDRRRGDLRARAHTSADAAAHLEKLEAFGEHFSRVIDAEQTGHQKKVLAEECNVEWKKFRFLGITPVVGAGISFDEKHFDQAFVYATPSSCCPRALNQLLGRVRNLRQNQVHIYLDESNALREGPPVPSEDALFAEIATQARNLKRIRLERMSARFNPEQNTVTYAFQNEDELLLRIHAMNQLESMTGRSDYRRELILCLQRNNPALNYRFNTKGEYRSDTRLYGDLEVIAHGIEDDEMKAVVTQEAIEDATELERVKASNQRGAIAFDDNENMQENVVKIIDKSDIQQQLGLESHTSEEIYEAYVGLLSDFPDGLETVANASKYLFGNIFQLKQKEAHLLEQRVFRREDGGDPFVLRERVAQGLDHLAYRRKYWLRRLLFICGFSENQGPEPAEALVEPVDPLEGHSGVLLRKLNEEHHQAWLKRNFRAILNDIGASMKRQPPDDPPEGTEREQKGDDFASVNVCWLLKRFLRKYTGLHLNGYSRDADGKRVRNKCADHSFERLKKDGKAKREYCRLQSTDDTQFRLLAGLCYQWLLNAPDFDWVVEARELARSTCERLQVGRLPGMAAHRLRPPALAGLFMEEAAFCDLARALVDGTRDTKLQLITNTRITRKRRKPQQDDEQQRKLSPEEKFEAKWAKVIDTHVGTCLYAETDPNVYLELLLSEAYKYKTIQFMVRCSKQMQKKLALLRRQKNGHA